MNGNRVLFTLTLLAAGLALATLSGPAQAALLTDDPQTQGLWHMEQIVGDVGSEHVADDNSVTGRTPVDMKLGIPALNPADNDTQPALTAGAPGMGNALLFDGIKDAAESPGAWDILADKVTIEYMVRPDARAGGDGYAGLVAIGPAQMYLYDVPNSEVSVVQALVFDAAGGAHYTTNWTPMTLEEWHSVKLDVTSDSVVTLTVDGVDAVGTAGPGMINGSAAAGWETHGVILGRMWYMSARHLTGALDEVKISVVPEPSTLVMVGLMGLAFALRRKV